MTTSIETINNIFLSFYGKPVDIKTKDEQSDQIDEIDTGISNLLDHTIYQKYLEFIIDECACSGERMVSSINYHKAIELLDQNIIKLDKSNYKPKNEFRLVKWKVMAFVVYYLSEFIKLNNNTTIKFENTIISKTRFSAPLYVLLFINALKLLLEYKPIEIMSRTKTTEAFTTMKIDTNEISTQSDHITGGKGEIVNLSVKNANILFEESYKKGFVKSDLIIGYIADYVFRIRLGWIFNEKKDNENKRRIDELIKISSDSIKTLIEVIKVFLEKCNIYINNSFSTDPKDIHLVNILDHIHKLKEANKEDHDKSIIIHEIEVIFINVVLKSLKQETLENIPFDISQTEQDKTIATVQKAKETLLEYMNGNTNINDIYIFINSFYTKK